MKFLIPGLLVFLCSSSSYAQTKNYDGDGAFRVVSSKTILKIDKIKKPDAAEKQAFGAIAGAVLPPLIKMGTSIAKDAAKKNALKYKAEYKAFASESGFYDQQSIYLPKLTLMRKIITSESAAQETAVKIIFTPELSQDGTAFRYVIKDKIKYLYSIAKTKGDYDYIDLTVDIKFKALSVHKNKYELNELRGTSMYIPSVKVGGTSDVDQNDNIVSGWIPFPPKPVLEVVIPDKVVKESKKTTTKAKKAIEVSEVETETTTHEFKDASEIQDMASVYEIELTVGEANPYKIKAENKQQLIENNGDSIAEVLNAIVDAAIPKKE